MTVLLLAPEPETISEHDLRSLSEHFHLHWPGTFVLGLMPELPPGLEANEQFDWMTWPLSMGDHSTAEDLSLLEKIMKRFEVQAVVGIGVASRDALESIGDGLILLTDKDKMHQEKIQGVYVLHLSPELHADFRHLDDWLVGRLAVDVLVSQAYDWGELLGRLENHAAVGRAKHLRVRWLGRACYELIRLLERLCELDFFGRSQIELELLSSDLFQVSRSGLTHSPADFLLRPAAWKQFAAFCRLLVTANPRVRVSVRTLSSKYWIRRSVDIANSTSDVIRGGLSIFRRHRK